jgi:hypothetical protein
MVAALDAFFVWHIFEYARIGSTLECHWPHVPCGKVLLPYAAILPLHFMLLLGAVFELIEKAPQFQKVVHAKR